MQQAVSLAKMSHSSIGRAKPVTYVHVHVRVRVACQGSAKRQTCSAVYGGGRTERRERMRRDGRGEREGCEGVVGVCQKTEYESAQHC